MMQIETISKMGFEIVGEINKKPYYLYQMRKENRERHSQIT